MREGGEEEFRSEEAEEGVPQYGEGCVRSVRVGGERRGEGSVVEVSVAACAVLVRHEREVLDSVPETLVDEALLQQCEITREGDVGTRSRQGEALGEGGEGREGRGVGRGVEEGEGVVRDGRRDGLVRSVLDITVSSRASLVRDGGAGGGEGGSDCCEWSGLGYCSSCGTRLLAQGLYQLCPVARMQAQQLIQLQ